MKRLECLEKSKELAVLHGLYDQALDLLDQLLLKYADDIDSLRLKGNIIDLKQLDREQHKTLPEDKRGSEDSKQFYEKILEIDPENPLALIDLGDYWRRKRKIELALKFYNNATTNLLNGKFYRCREEECEEGFHSKAEFLYEIGRIKDSLQCLKEGLKLCRNSDLLNELKEQIQEDLK
jgi:tetratricopeptide (TPR) repeat protein